MKCYRLRAKGQSNRQAEGFALFELLIACALIALVGVIAGSAFSFLPRYGLMFQARLLSASIRGCQYKALATGTPCSMLFSDDQRYRIGAREHTLPTGVYFGWVPDSSGPPSRPNRLICRAATFENNILTCHPDGTLTPGTVYLTDSARRWMCAVSCAIDHGVVTTYRYDQGDWRLW